MATRTKLINVFISYPDDPNCALVNIGDIIKERDALNTKVANLEKETEVLRNVPPVEPRWKNKDALQLESLKEEYHTLEKAYAKAVSLIAKLRGN